MTMASPSFGFFCRTYHKDADRLHYLLRSIEKFCTGFSGITITTLASSEEKIRPISEEFPFSRYIECETTAPHDFIGQQITKMTANYYTDYDYIIYIDSDCVIDKPITPDDFMADGRPIMLMEPYSLFYNKGSNVPWQTVTSKFARRQVDYEFMRTFPLTYPRNFYADFQAWFEKNNGMPIEDVWKRVQGDYFSEFNLMGAFSYYSDTPYHSFKSITEGYQYRSCVSQFCRRNSREDRSIGKEDLEFLAALLA